jgi:hypothetical protein
MSTAGWLQRYAVESTAWTLQPSKRRLPCLASPFSLLNKNPSIDLVLVSQLSSFKHLPRSRIHTDKAYARRTNMLPAYFPFFFQQASNGCIYIYSFGIYWHLIALKYAYILSSITHASLQKIRREVGEEVSMHVVPSPYVGGCHSQHLGRPPPVSRHSQPGMLFCDP